MKVGDRVFIKTDGNLPHPQCMYQGQSGVIVGIKGYIHVSPDNALSGADKRCGLPFKAIELELRNRTNV